MGGFGKAFIERHGEIGVLPILENWERLNRIRHSHMVTIEERWEHFIRATDTAASIAA